ncbi:hypothetical protein HMPREF0742_01970 [Rothia aeria F0184]|uniref:Uncharacterized protein n=1 Tax=Rothia aeria F0184 TaxID=888019 RepID=U7V0S7_9MICC|nr:hypothetical protein HMPREF0742_01970 [Rothia aeria F0184]
MPSGRRVPHSWLLTVAPRTLAGKSPALHTGPCCSRLTCTLTG